MRIAQDYKNQKQYSNSSKNKAEILYFDSKIKTTNQPIGYG